jgi:streptogramin lyase
VTVVNKDGFAHAVDAKGLTNRDPVFGATNWGQFEWEQLGAAGSVAAGASQTFTYSPSSKAFQLVIGDPTSGDQAQAAITLDRGPIQESFRVPGPAFSMPLHDAIDADGNVWLTLAGADKIARLTPADKLGDSAYVEFNLPVPPGTPAGAPVGFFEPLDIAVDPQGIIWATLPVANAIARLDPALAHPGTTDGIEIFTLADCPATECRIPPPPVVPGALSREPVQMALRTAADGSTEVWFTELFADKIGVVKRLPSGQYLQQHFTCACKVVGQGGGVAAGTPLGIDVDATGRVWFTAANKNAIGRITPGADPFASSVIQTELFQRAGYRRHLPHVGSPQHHGKPRRQGVVH